MKRTMFLWIAAALFVGFPLSSSAGPCADDDMDGICNVLDNCSAIANASQVDVDGDLCGNRCDNDFSQDGVVAGADFAALAGAFSGPGIPPGLQDTGSDPPDGVVAGADFASLAGQFSGPPGPSGTTSGTTACP